jgi:hypothetical protein
MPLRRNLQRLFVGIYRVGLHLLAHLGTLARNELRFAGTPAAVPVLTEPTPRQQEAFDLIGAPIPTVLRK